MGSRPSQQSCWSKTPWTLQIGIRPSARDRGDQGPVEKPAACQGDEGRFSLRSTCCDWRTAVAAIVSGTMIVDVLLGATFRVTGRGAALVSAACSVGLAAGFAAWTWGFAPVSRAGLL